MNFWSYFFSVLAGRRPGLLRDIKRRHASIERETERILTTISRVEG